MDQGQGLHVLFCLAGRTPSPLELMLSHVSLHLQNIGAPYSMLTKFLGPHQYLVNFLVEVDEV
jgi:hypothetical protein